MRIILFGIPDFGAMCLETLVRANKNIVGVVLPPENHPAAFAMKLTAEQFGVPTVHVGRKMKDPRLIDDISGLKPDLIIIAAYSRLIPPEIYQIPRLGAINCHPSYLPQYRGSNPYFHVIANGEKETGITFHYLDNTFDTGDIVYQCKVPLARNETLGTLFYRLSMQSSHLYLELITKLEQGEELQGIPQPEVEGELKPAPEVRLNDSAFRINWSDDVNKIERLVRASNPFFGAYTTFRNTIFKIWSGHFDSKPVKNIKLPPGAILKVSKDSMAINTGSGIYYPTVVEFGMFYTCDIREIVSRLNPNVGELLN